MDVLSCLGRKIHYFSVYFSLKNPYFGEENFYGPVFMCLILISLNKICENGVGLLYSIFTDSLWFFNNIVFVGLGRSGNFLNFYLMIPWVALLLYKTFPNRLSTVDFSVSIYNHYINCWS